MPWQEDDLPEPPQVSRRLAWAETALLAATGPALGFWLRPADPLFVHASFFWPLLGPLLAALRYGTINGLAAGLAVIALVAARVEQEVPGPLIAALLVVVLLAGAMTDRLARRVERAERRARLSADRTARFIRAYHTMTASHELLERTLRSSGHSLREALSALRTRLSGRPGGAQTEREARQAILDLFAEYAGVHLATFHPVGRSGELRPPEATLGQAPILLPSHPMLQEALRQKKVVSVAIENADEPGLIAAVPLVEVTGRVIAVVAIHEMPFTSLTEDALQLMAVLGGAIADLVGTFLREEPETEHQAFITQLRRAQQDRHRYGLDVTLVCVRLDDAQGGGHLASLAAERRGSDVALMTQDARGVPVLALLLPLANEAGAQSFLGRLQRIAGTSAGLAARTHAITPDDTIESLVSFIREPGQSNDGRRLRLAGA